MFCEKRVSRSSSHAVHSRGRVFGKPARSRCTQPVQRELPKVSKNGVAVWVLPHFSCPGHWRERSFPIFALGRRCRGRGRRQCRNLYVKPSQSLSNLIFLKELPAIGAILLAVQYQSHLRRAANCPSSLQLNSAPFLRSSSNYSFTPPNNESISRPISSPRSPSLPFLVSFGISTSSPPLDWTSLRNLACTLTTSSR